MLTDGKMINSIKATKLLFMVLLVLSVINGADVLLSDVAASCRIPVTVRDVDKAIEYFDNVVRKMVYYDYLKLFKDPEKLDRFIGSYFPNQSLIVNRALTHSPIIP